MSDERREMIIHSTGIALMGPSWWKLHLKILIQWLGVISRYESQQWLQWDLYVKHTMSSGCWIEPDEQCADNCPHSLYGQRVPNPVACWKPATASKSMNNAQAKGGASPWGQSLSFLLGNPHLPRQSPSQAHHPKCLSLSLHCNRARPLVNLQASSPLSVFMKTKSFWSNIKKGKIKFQLPDSAVPVVHHSRSNSNVTSSDTWPNSSRQQDCTSAESIHFHMYLYCHMLLSLLW